MANTRQSGKRARQANRRQTRNVTVRSATRSAIKGALDALKSQDLSVAKEAYKAAVRNLAKAASKGAMPRARAARKVSRLTALVKKSLPTILK